MRKLITLIFVISSFVGLSQNGFYKGWPTFGTAVSSTTIDGSAWYTTNTTNGFTFYSNDATNTGYHSVFTNSLQGVAYYFSTAGGTKVQIGTYSNDALGFFTGTGSVKMRIAALGNVGINLASEPTSTFQVVGTAAVSQSLTAGGCSLTAGSFSVGSKVINTTAGDAATIDSPVGRFRKDATGTTFVLTDAFITANSIIVLTCADAGTDTQRVYGIVAGAGSATITFYNYVLGVATATAPAANSDINFIIMN